MMRVLLLIAHGSRRQVSNDEVQALTQQLAALVSGRFDQVRYCFLELAEPSIPDAIAACAQGGAREIVVLPYFLSAGNHVHADIPEHLEQARHRHPDVRFETRPYFGSAPGVSALLAQLAS